MEWENEEENFEEEVPQMGRNTLKKQFSQDFDDDDPRSIGKRKKTNGAVDAAAGVEEAKSLKGRIQAVQDILVLIQCKTDFLLGLLDRIRK